MTKLGVNNKMVAGLPKSDEGDILIFIGLSFLKISQKPLI